MRSTFARWGLSLVFASLFAVFVHEGTLVGVDKRFSANANQVAAIVEVQDLIARRWVEEPEDGQLVTGAVRGMVGTLDRFSAFIPEQKKETFERQTTGQFGGLGIWINVKEGLVVVIAPIEDTPAWKAGILPSDTILSVDGVPCEFKDTPDAVKALAGRVGSKVKLKVLHEGSEEPVEIEVERARIQIRSVKGVRLLDTERKIGYLRLTTFNSGTFQEFARALAFLHEQGMRALILDLRGNPGGFLDQAVKIANAFLEEDTPILITRSRDKGEKRTVASGDRLTSAPTCVLIDQGSASASEILGGALQDNEAATLVGARSYGKGSVQSIIKILGGKAELKLTTQYYFTPKERRIHRGDKPEEDLSWGLLPEVKVAIPLRQRWILARHESQQEMERLKAAARNETWKGKERLHFDDPQVRAAYKHLLGTLEDTVPPEVAEAEAREQKAREEAEQAKAAKRKAEEDKLKAMQAKVKAMKQELKERREILAEAKATLKSAEDALKSATSEPDRAKAKADLKAAKAALEAKQAELKKASKAAGTKR